MNKLTKLALAVVASVGLVGAAQAGMHHWWGQGPDCPYGYQQDCPRYHQGNWQGDWQRGAWQDQRGWHHNEWCARQGYREGYRDGYQDAAERGWRPTIMATAHVALTQLIATIAIIASKVNAVMVSIQASSMSNSRPSLKP